MIAILCLLCTRFLLTSSSDHTEEFIETNHGKEVTLVPTYSGDASGISWWLRGYILLDIKLKPSNETYYYPNFNHLKGRADINPSNGRLTIRALNSEDSGYYRAETVVNHEVQVTRLWLIVIDQQLDGVEAAAGSEVTLDLKHFGDPVIISWWRGPRILVELEKKPPERIAFYSLKKRAAIDGITGRLTIRNVTSQDSGVYRAEMLVDNKIQTSAIRLSVR